jgi:proteasome lid subunit RPN8/RPN11
MTDSGKLWISLELAEKIRRHGAETYPNECCGALLGRDANFPEGPVRAREVSDVLPLVNRRDDSPQSRFSVAPADVIAADKAARSRGLEIIGWYHSHPDHPAKPSEYDRENAWPWYSYLIVSVQAGIPQEMTSWRLKDDRNEYWQETVEIRTEATARP